MDSRSNSPKPNLRIDNEDKFDAVAIAVNTAHTTTLKGSYPAVFTESIPDTTDIGSYIGVSLIDFIDDRLDPKDPINGNSYSIPGDCMLFLSLERVPLPSGLSLWTPAQSPLNVNFPISIFGYPLYTSLNLVYPLNTIRAHKYS